MSTRFAFVGFRHAHINALYNLVKDRDGLEIVAACEEDAETRKQLPKAGIVITHESYPRMLSEVECDVVACGDYYSVRGERLIEALETGRHVMGDKPLCTRLDELNRIQTLAMTHQRAVGCMFDLPNLGPYITLREVIRKGVIGEVHTINFWAQHPLLYGTRPMWYFEEGKHGGTLNDIACHAIDIVPWLTGRAITEITAARAWNARVSKHPRFQDGGVLLLRLDNGGAVMGDVSYLSSDKHGYTMQPYWRFTVSGSKGVAETNCMAQHVAVWHGDRDAMEEIPVAAHATGAFLDDFLDELAGKPSRDGLTTERVLKSNRSALLAQQCADTASFPCGL